LHIRFNPDFLAYKATLTNGPLPTLGQVQTETLLLQQGDLIYTQQKKGHLFNKKCLFFYNFYYYYYQKIYAYNYLVMIFFIVEKVFSASS